MSYIKQNFLEFVTNLTCPHEDEKLAFWMKLVLGFICAVSILNVLLFGTDENYLVALSGMVIVLVGNCLICRKYKQWWIDVVTCWLLSVPVGYIFCLACV